MGSNHNRIRKKWQDYGGSNAVKAENTFFDCFSQVFEGTNYSIISKPKDFQNLYITVSLSDEVLKEIYNPINLISRHGVFPDYAIENKITNKRIYVEVKRQDGWVENKRRSDGRGNAHERSCKFFTPGLISTLREKSGIKEPALPFWTVFIGDITETHAG
jgi:Type II restriction enzyme MunI